MWTVKSAKVHTLRLLRGKLKSGTCSILDNLTDCSLQYTIDVPHFLCTIENGKIINVHADTHRVAEAGYKVVDRDDEKCDTQSRTLWYTIFQGPTGG